MKQSCLLYRKTVNFLLLFVSLTLSTATILRAEGSLFTEVDPQTLTLNATQQSIVNYFSNLPYNAGLKYALVENLATIQENGVVSFTIPGFETSALTFTNVDVQYSTASDYTWLGQLDLAQGELTFYAKPEGYGGTIDLGTKLYSINTLGGNLALIMKHDLTAYPPGKCGSDSASDAEATDFCAVDDCGGSVVDVLVLTTPAAAAIMSTLWGNLADFYLWQGTHSINDALVLSGIPNKRVRLQYLSFVPGFTLTTNPINDVDSLSVDPTTLSFFNTNRVDIIVMLTNQIYRDQNGNRVFGIANSASPTSTNKFCIVEAGFLLDPATRSPTK